VKCTEDRWFASREREALRASDCVTRVVLAPHADLEDLWPSIITPADVTDRLLRHAALALAVRAKLPFTTTALHGLFLLYGPPGTGKTTLARGLAQELAGVVEGPVRLIDINPHGLMSADHGRSQQLVAELMTEVVPGHADGGRPTIVVLDEVESMAVARSEASLGANPVDVHRATDAVLTALDDLTLHHPHILTVATSNFTAGLDSAFVSRADLAIEVPLPSPTALTAILRDALRGYATVFGSLKTLLADDGLRAVGEAMAGMDGREARKLVANAAARRLETATNPGMLTIEDLLEAAATRGERRMSHSTA
jgi:AAA+ superfamily predicted ATPase